MMRALLPLLLLFCTAAAPQPAVVETLAPDAEARWVPFTLTPANQIQFTLLLDGRPVSAILDTGVTASVVARRHADAAHMQVRPGASALTISGSVASGWVDLGDVAFGALTRRGGRAAVTDLPLAATGGVAIDMLIGGDIIAGYALDLDYAARRFRLLRSGRMPFAGNVAALRYGAATTTYGPGYVSEITIGGARIDRVLIDTGDGTALTLARATWNALPAPRPATVAASAYSIGGVVRTDRAILPDVRSAGAAPLTLETRIEPRGGFLDQLGLRARIGSGLLGHYRVLLDPAAGRMVLAAGTPATVPAD